MASRMERYYKKDSSNFKGRSAKNADIYKNIQDLDSYSNIEAVKTIETTNQVDITKVKEMLKERENYKNERKYHQAMKDSPIGVVNPRDKMTDNHRSYDIMDIKPEEDQIVEEEKNYDIVDVISKAKEENDLEENKYRNLKNTNYQEINNLNLRKEEFNNSEEELKELIHTISNNSELNKLSESQGLLDELKSDTMVGDASSISQMIEKEKQLEPTITSDLDKSFFGSSFGFSKSDFVDGVEKPKKKKWWILILIILLLAIAGVLVWFFLLKK